MTEAMPDAITDAMTDAIPDTFTGPGLVDLQVNGYAGFDFNSDPDAWTPEAWHEVRTRMMARGVVAAFPTLITNAPEIMVRQAAAYASLTKTDAELAAFFPRLHVEGPFISPETGPRGAHPLEYCLLPENAPDLMQGLHEAAEGRIGIVTLAPELPGAIPLIERLVACGILVAFGHTSASAAELEAGTAAGARMATHLGNGSHAVLPRHENYIQVQLADDRLHASFIADGHHLPRYTLKNFIRAKGVERSILVTDAIAAAGMGPGTYQLANMTIEVSESLRATKAGHDGLAGAAITLDRCILNTARHAAVPFEEAWAMASSRPAALLGLDEPEPVTVRISAEGFERTA